ncbi:MAG: hypothetical protein HY735_00480 [Verrucomicrobia bacterium]|nr:hypothetical protein [Verrucomicrobiota bacterium]
MRPIAARPIPLWRKVAALAAPVALLTLLSGHRESEISGSRLQTHEAATPGETIEVPRLKFELRSDLSPDDRLTANIHVTNVSQALAMYEELIGRQLLPRTKNLMERLDELLHGRLSRWRLVQPAPAPDRGVSFHRDGLFTAGQLKKNLEVLFKTYGITLAPVGRKHFRAVLPPNPKISSDRPEKDEQQPFCP